MEIPPKFLDDLSRFRGAGGSDGIGICYHDPNTNEYHPLPDFGCDPGRRGEFEATAPANALLYSGVVVAEIHRGYVACPDRRAGGRFAGTAQGWSRPGESPLAAARREWCEEVVAWLDGMDMPRDSQWHGQRVQLVPYGIEPSTHVPMLGIDLNGHRSVGEIKPVGIHLTTPKVAEFLFVWNLRPFITPDEETTLLRMLWTEQIDADRTYFGSNLVVLDHDTGEYVATFCGRQPLLDLRSLPLHPVLRRYQELVTGGS